jgi:hypothetical protein
MRKRIVIEIDHNDMIKLVREFFYSKGAPPTADLEVFVKSDGVRMSEFDVGASVEWYLSDDVDIGGEISLDTKEVGKE